MLKISGLPEAYQKLLDISRQHKALNQKYLQKIKRNQPIGLDKTIHRLHEQAFRLIDCKLCANCCMTLGPRITDRDIQKMAKSLRIKPSVLTGKWLDIDEDGDYVFRDMPCPFLNQEKLCKIYDSRPTACAGYPHTDQPRQAQILTLTLKNALICPAVAQIFEWLREQ
jgi:hypothetical protein